MKHTITLDGEDTNWRAYCSCGAVSDNYDGPNAAEQAWWYHREQAKLAEALAVALKERP
jgi:hypothetical protein